MSRPLGAAVALLALAAAAVADCVVSSDTILAGKACPCDTALGYICDCSIDKCVKNPCEAGLIVNAGRCVDPQTDPSNCGRCGVACLANEAVMSCESGECVAVACSQAVHDPTDYNFDFEGGACARAVAGPTECVSAESDCRLQFSRGMCRMGDGPYRCVCGSDFDCLPGRCDMDAGRCHCAAEHCGFGENCGDSGMCSCNGSEACDAQAREICCPTQGCVQVETDRENCGACGQRCPPFFACGHVSPPNGGPGPRTACRCMGDDQCAAGGDPDAGCDLDSGLCVCGDEACPQYGQRCLLKHGKPTCG